MTTTTVLEKFADIQLLQYKLEGWEKLSDAEQNLAYYLAEAGKYGRDIVYDQNYEHNLLLRDTLEKMYAAYAGFRGLQQFRDFEEYLKRFWFSRGFHHHYSANKFVPPITTLFIEVLIKGAKIDYSQYKGYSFKDEDDFIHFIQELVLNPEIAPKKLSLDPSQDMVQASAVNFYAGSVTQKEAETFYQNQAKQGDAETPISYGLNSRLLKENGELAEQVYKLEGKYSEAIAKIIENLNLATQYAESQAQKEVIKLLVTFYETGDLAQFDAYSIAWVKLTDTKVHFINGFIETYEDPLGLKGSYESLVAFKNEQLSEKLSVIGEHASWFEEQMPFSEAFKRKTAPNQTYTVIDVLSTAGESDPTIPLGINLPNADWIREKHGSKSVSLANIEDAHEAFDANSAYAREFYTPEQLALVQKFGAWGSKLHTCLHEVIGHGSGKLASGVAAPSETLKNYASTIEEARADLVALYFLPDAKLQELGIIESSSLSEIYYETYLFNGIMGQLKRIPEGEVVEESHMRNRQLIAQWIFQNTDVAEMQKVEGKSYIKVKDYVALREKFGTLLAEIQRIKSEGDYEAAKQLVEAYAVQPDSALHAEVLERHSKLEEAPYRGFVSPKLQLEGDKVLLQSYGDFAEQMLAESARYTTLL